MSSAPALVILAAGASERLGFCKALAPLTPKTPLELLLAAGRCFDGAAPLVITGQDHDAIAAAAPRGVEVRRNSDWERGRTGGVLLAASLRSGLDLCLAPVDVPLVPASVFEALLAAWLRSNSPGRGWLAPSFTPKGSPSPRFGHPVVLGRDLLQDHAGLEPKTPLNRLRERGDPVFSVEVGAPEILDDLDDPEDFGRLQGRSGT
jgi:molybdenum cofactor cytidylyltransferase